MTQAQAAYPTANAKAANDAQATKAGNASGLQERDWNGVGMLTQEDKDTGSSINAMYIGVACSVTVSMALKSVNLRVPPQVKLAM